MTIRAKTYSRKAKNSILKLLSLWLLMCFCLSANPAMALEKEANATCAGVSQLSDKKYDMGQCEMDSKCAGASDCIDSTPLGSVSRLSSPFGYRYHPIDKKWKEHKGIDYAAGYGTPIYAAADGVIEARRYQYDEKKGTGYGNLIDLKVDNQPGVVVRYAHMACFAPGISVGTHVKKGQIIGFVGNTGGSTGNHLHYEIKKNNVSVDPLEDNTGVPMCTVDPRIDEMNKQYAHDGEKPGTGGGTGGSTGGGDVVLGGGSSHISSPPGNPTKDKDCFPSVFKKALEECMFCSLFQTVFKTASDIAKAAFNLLAGPVTIVVSVAFGLWIAFNLLAFLSSVESKDAPTFIKKLINQSFIVIVVVVFLKGDTASFMGLALEPIFNTGFKLAQMTMKSDFVCTDSFGLADKISDGGLPASMGINIVCTIKVIQEKLVDVMSLGSTSMCVARYIKNFYIFPHLGFFFSGVAIWAVGLLLLIIFPFLMLDAVVQMAAAVALLPAALGAYTFKLTRSYVTKVWESFLSTMFHFVFLTIIMMILITVIENTMKQSINAAVSPEAVEAGGWDRIIENLSWTGVMFLQLIFVFLLGWAVLGEIAKFANKFASSVTGGTNIGSQIGTLGASAATNTAKRVGAPIIQSIGSHASSGAKALYNEAAEGINSIRQARRSESLQNGQMSSQEGYSQTTDESGNTTYNYQTRSGLFRKFKDRSTTLDKDGNIVTESTRKKKSGGNQEQAADLNGVKMNSLLDKDGNEVFRDYIITDKEAAKISTDGIHINKDALQKLQNNLAIGQKRANEIAMMAMMKQRMPGVMDDIERSKNIKDQGQISQNANGNLQMNKFDKDGNEHAFQMSIDPQSGQIINTYDILSKADKNGERTLTRRQSNGVVEMTSGYKVNAAGQRITGTEKNTKFAVNSAYTRNRNSLPLDYYGNLAGYMPDEAKTFAGISESEVAKMKKQFREQRSNQSLDGFSHRAKKQQNFLGRWSNYLSNKGKAILQVDDEYIGLSEEEIIELKQKNGGAEATSKETTKF